MVRGLRPTIHTASTHHEVGHASFHETIKPAWGVARIPPEYQRTLVWDEDEQRWLNVPAHLGITKADLAGIVPMVGYGGSGSVASGCGSGPGAAGTADGVNLSLGVAMGLGLLGMPGSRNGSPIEGTHNGPYGSAFYTDRLYDPLEGDLTSEDSMSETCSSLASEMGIEADEEMDAHMSSELGRMGLGAPGGDVGVGVGPGDVDIEAILSMFNPEERSQVSVSDSHLSLPFSSWLTCPPQAMLFSPPVKRTQELEPDNTHASLLPPSKRAKYQNHPLPYGYAQYPSSSASNTPSLSPEPQPRQQADELDDEPLTPTPARYAAQHQYSRTKTTKTQAKSHQARLQDAESALWTSGWGHSMDEFLVSTAAANWAAAGGAQRYAKAAARQR